LGSGARTVCVAARSRAGECRFQVIPRPLERHNALLIPGEIDDTRAPELNSGEALAAKPQAVGDPLVIDLCEVAFVDYRGLGAGDRVIRR
jgi:hypothetical protein